MPRVYVRKFDHEEARRRHAAGETFKQIAETLGVSHGAISYAVTPGAAGRMTARTSSWQKGGICPECGGPCSRNRSVSAHRCMACAAKARITTVRATELYCGDCKSWLPDNSFPRNRSETHRRGRHDVCRSCTTIRKRDYRERHKVPCSHGCGRMVESKGRRYPDRPPECHPCANARRWAEWQQR